MNLMNTLFKDIKTRKTIDIKSQTGVLVTFYFLTGYWLQGHVHFMSV